MASTAILTPDAGKRRDRVLAIRLGIVAVLLIGWQALSYSGLLYRDVVPPLQVVAKATLGLWSDPSFYRHVGTTAYELIVALVIGVGAGMFTGVVLGGNRFAQEAFERYLYYLGPTPKIVFFPIMIMWFGVGPGSKIAMGALSCFFPVSLSTAAAIRGISPILVRVGRSCRATPWQMAAKIYLPAMRESVANSIRLGFGIALIGTLLAETKISNGGIGFLVIQSFQRFDMPLMYSLIITVFMMSIILNTLMTMAVTKMNYGKVIYNRR